MYLNEMATSWRHLKKDIIDKLDSPIIEHLVKIYYHHDTQWCKGWIKSVRAPFATIPKLTNTNRFPTYEQIFQGIWNNALDGIIDNKHRGWAKFLNRRYIQLKPIEEIDYEGFKDFAMQYFKLCATHISEFGGVDLEDVFEFIENYFDIEL